MLNLGFYSSLKYYRLESNPVQTSPCSIYPQVQHNIDRLRRSSISSPHRSMLQREDVQRTVLQREEDAVRPPPHHSVILPPRERFSHSQLFKPGPRQQQMIRERPPVPQYYKCPICKFYYDTEQKLHFHMELHNERFPDPVVIPNPPHPHEYPDGTLSVSPIDYYLCSECNQNFSSEDDYRRHLLVHMFKCRFCNVTLENEVSFLSHMKGHGDHSSIPFACFLCGKQFSHLQHLHAHILTHPDERPYACQECNKHFSRKGHLTRHMSTHSKEKPYVCKECNKAFAHKTHLRRHEIVHSGARPFKCRLCEHAFSRKSSLSRHYFIHTTEKPFVCPVCEKGFNRKGRLKNHLKIHIREGHHELVDYVIERRPITKEFIERINNLKPESDTEPTIRASVSSEYSDERSVHIEPSHLTQLSEVKEESDDSSSTDSEMDEGEGELSEEISYCDPIKSTSDQERHSPSYRSSTMVALPRLDDSVTPYQPSTMVALPHRSEHTKTPNEQNNNTTPYQSPVLVPLSHGENRSNSNGVSNI